jgi:hypothetical protein
MQNWIDDRQNKLREFFGLDSATELISPESNHLPSRRTSPRICKNSISNGTSFRRLLPSRLTLTITGRGFTR